MTKPSENIPLDFLESFHKFNLFLPSRTIYFGGTDEFFKEESDTIDAVTVAELIKNLHILDCLNHNPLNIILNTCGGYVDDGMAAYDVMKLLSSPIVIIGVGKIYSMGSILFQAAGKRLITKNALFLIHDGTSGYVGDPKSFERWAKKSKDSRKRSYQIYYDRMKEKNPKITLKQIENMCEHDTILTAEETVKLGLADGII